MTPAEIAHYKGASDVFEFNIANADVADTFVFSGDDWGSYSSNGVDLADAARPGLAADGVTSVASSVTFSVTLFHLAAFSSAHVSWEGTGCTLEYTLDGTTWVALTQNAAIDLAADPDLDIRVNFAGGVVDDTAALTSLTVYVLATDTIKASSHRVATFSADSITPEGIKLDEGKLDIPIDSVENPGVIGTVEFWARRDESGVTTYMYATSDKYVAYVNTTNNLAKLGVTVYVNGALSTGTNNAYASGTWYHYVVVTDGTPANESVKLGIAADGTVPSDITVSHLAFYEAKLTAAEAAALYAAQSTKLVRIDDPGAFTVAESSPATDVYAYSWAHVSSG